MDKTTQELIDESTKKLSDACFEYGRIRYQINVKQLEVSDLEQKLKDIDIKFYNFDVELVNLYKVLAKEKAAKLKIAPPVPEAVIEAQTSSLEVVQ